MKKKKVKKKKVNKKTKSKKPKKKELIEIAEEFEDELKEDVLKVTA